MAGMRRKTRAESRTETRERLLGAASRLFGRDGFTSTSVERIAEEAGFSKGALYSNFEGKEAVFLAVLERQGTDSLDAVVAEVAAAASADAVRARLVEWADERSKSGNWSMAILEHARAAGPGSPSVTRQALIIRAHWRRLGTAVLTRLPGVAGDAELLGALLHEIAYAPALTFMTSPSAGALMAVVIERLER